jgi:hypothetical protein
MDTFGSNATAMGGAAGRSDAMVGAVEAQKAEGVLHVHLFLYVQMITQFGTLHELAEALQSKLLEADTVKRYVSYVRCASYPQVEAFRLEKPRIEKEWPAFTNDQSLCRLPRFFWGASRCRRVSMATEVSDQAATCIVSQEPSHSSTCRRTGRSGNW